MKIDLDKFTPKDVILIKPQSEIKVNKEIPEITEEVDTDGIPVTELKKKKVPSIFRLGEVVKGNHGYEEGDIVLFVTKNVIELDIVKNIVIAKQYDILGTFKK